MIAMSITPQKHSYPLLVVPWHICPQQGYTLTSKGAKGQGPVFQNKTSNKLQHKLNTLYTQHALCRECALSLHVYTDAKNLQDCHAN